MKMYLIIEDDPVMHLIYSKKMKNDSRFADYKALKAISLPEALDIVSKLEPDEMPDFVFLDINLGQGFTGWDFLNSEEAKRLPKSTLIFVSTSSASTADKSKAEEYPEITGYFIKPITTANLDYIHELLTRV